MAQFSPARLRGFRDWQNLSRAALAARIGRSAEAVQQWEKARAHPTEESLAAVAFALGIDVADMDRVHDDPTEDYIDAVLHRAPPLPPDALEAAALVLRRANGGRAARRPKGGAPAA